MSEIVTPGIDASPASAPIETSGTTESQSSSYDATFFSELSSDQVPTKKTELPADSVEKLKADAPAKEKKEAKVESKEKTKEEKDIKEDVKDKEAKPSSEAQKKTLKAKSGESELDIPEDAVFKVKVGGQDIEVPLKELQANYSGKTHWDKKFTELSNEKGKFNQMKNDAESKIKAIFESPSAEERFYRMAEFSGKNPVEVRREFLTENIKLLEKYYSMSDDEKKADELQFENQYLKHQQETLKKSSELKQTQEVLKSKVEKIKATHQIADDQFVSRYDEIQSLVKEGKIEESKLTPEFIAETIVKDNLWTAAEQAITKFGIDFPDALKPKKIMDLIDVSYQNGITNPKDIEEMVNEVWGTKGKKAVIDDKSKQRSEFLEGPKDPKKSTPKRFDDDLWNFDQL